MRFHTTITLWRSSRGCWALLVCSHPHREMACMGVTVCSRQLLMKTVLSCLVPEQPCQTMSATDQKADRAMNTQQKLAAGGHRGRPEPSGIAPPPGMSRMKIWLWRSFYQSWRILPHSCQRLAVRIAAPKVTLGACAVILDDRGRVLLAHHTYRERPWGLPGGFVNSSEQPDAGLSRELREELGVEAQVGPVLSAETNPTTHQLTLYYRATLLGRPREDGIEIDGLRFAAPEEVPTLLGDDALTCLQCMQGDRFINPHDRLFSGA